YFPSSPTPPESYTLSLHDALPISITHARYSPASVSPAPKGGDCRLAPLVLPAGDRLLWADADRFGAGRTEQGSPGRHAVSNTARRAATLPPVNGNGVAPTGSGRGDSAREQGTLISGGRRRGKGEGEDEVDDRGHQADAEEDPPDQRTGLGCLRVALRHDQGDDPQHEGERVAAEHTRDDQADRGALAGRRLAVSHRGRRRTPHPSPEASRRGRRALPGRRGRRRRSVPARSITHTRLLQP